MISISFSSVRISQRGFSLVELMVALALGVILSAAIIQIFITSKNVYRMQEVMSRNQENARFAFEYMSRDLRMAGYVGCGNLDRVAVNVIADPPSDFMQFDPSTFMTGYDNVSSSNDWGAKEGTDVIEVRRASGLGTRLTGVLTTNNANIQIVNNRAGFKQNDTVIISDCINADIFNVVNKPKQNDDKKVTLAHSSGGNTNSKLSKLYGADAELMAFESITYYVAPSGRSTVGGRSVDALWMRVNNSAGAPVDIELVDGVEDLQLEYGVDTTGNRAANAYRKADAVADWSRVASIRVAILVAGSEDNTALGNYEQSIEFNDGAVLADGALRDVYEGVVAVRNRIP